MSKVRLRLLTSARGGVYQTIRARFYKFGQANVLHQDGMNMQAIIEIETDEDTILDILHRATRP